MPFAHSNLFNYIRKHNTVLSMKERFDIIDQVISAIKYAHQKGILHRDISPNNVLVFLEGEKLTIKVADFGLGKDSDSISHYTGSSATGYGQILYVSPEQRQRLKDANFQSDIYSLGKLIYFIYTGKDPDNIKTFELSTLVNISTEEDPQKRFKSIEEFEKHYVSLKNIQLNTEIPMKYITLKDVAETKAKIDLHYLHKILVEGNVMNHPYSDYIAPVVKIFGDRTFLTQYYHTVGNAISDFVTTFSQRLEDCYDTVGWPFSEASSFGVLLKNIALLIPDDKVRLICLKHLWQLAFKMDQWSVQRDILQVLNANYISSAISTSLAEYIISAEVEVDMQRFQTIALPNSIKIAIINASDIAKAKLEARRSANGILPSSDF